MKLRFTRRATENIRDWIASIVVRTFERKESTMVSGTRSCAFAVLMIVGIAMIQPARAEGDECISLYVQRNRIYADAHYCFKTETALQYFSNSGCIPGEPRLTSSQQRQVAEIQRQERRYNCRKI
jgi:hypothetical protein